MPLDTRNIYILYKYTYIDSNRITQSTITTNQTIPVSETLPTVVE